ncbi:35797_t:CDS:2, partial [Racocetra persica]
MTSEQKYPGYEEITFYLMRYKKSFWGFLLCYRDTIINTTIPISHRQNLEGGWVDSEWKRYNFENYWNDIILEYKIKEDILVCETEEARIQGELLHLRYKLSEIQENIKLQNNLEMDKDSVNEDPVYNDIYVYERVTKKRRSSRQPSRRQPSHNFEDNNYNNGSGDDNNNNNS